MSQTRKIEKWDEPNRNKHETWTAGTCGRLPMSYWKPCSRVKIILLCTGSLHISVSCAVKDMWWI